MSPSSTRAFAVRLAEDDAFRAFVAEDPKAALAEYGLRDAPGLIPVAVDLPPAAQLAALGLAEEPEPPPPPPTPKPPPPTPSPVSVQLFDPD
jgi:hypothetical protein